MKVSGIQWYLYLGITLVAITAGILLADKILEQKVPTTT